MAISFFSKCFVKCVPLAMLAVFAILIQPAISQVVKIGPGDAIKLIVRGAPDVEAKIFGGLYKVDAAGRLVGLPMLKHNLQAGGLTEEELSRDITNAYKVAEIYKKATFTAMVDTPLQVRRVTVIGQAMRQGALNYIDDMTAFDAYSAAGGADRFGQPKRVFLIRPGAKKQGLNMTVNADRIVRLLPGDTLEVGRKSAFEP